MQTIEPNKPQNGQKNHSNTPKGFLLSIALTLAYISTLTLSQARPIAYQNVKIDGKTYPIVIVELNDDNTITYTINQQSIQTPLYEAPPEIRALLAPKPKPKPQQLSSEEIQAIKQKWEDWGKRAKEKNQQGTAKTNENSQLNTPLTQNPSGTSKPKNKSTIEDILNDTSPQTENNNTPTQQTEPTELSTEKKAPAKVLIIAQKQTPEGTLAQRFEHKGTNPSIELLSYHLAPEVPYTETILIKNLKSNPNQKKALLIQFDGTQKAGGTTLKTYKILEEMAPPAEVFL